MIADTMTFASVSHPRGGSPLERSIQFRGKGGRGRAPLVPAVTSPAESLEASEESHLLDRVKAGDEEAAKELIAQLYPTVLRSVRSHRARRTSEEDLVQTILMRVFLNLKQFSGQVPIQHWVSRIAVNTCLNQLKHEIIRPELRMSDLREEEEAVIRKLAATDEDLPVSQTSVAREILDKLLARLRPDERLVITLLHLEERSTEEISQLTGWSVPLVKVKAFRSRAKMRKLWKVLYGDERP